jgi:AraC-like DNA-binding protein
VDVEQSPLELTAAVRQDGDQLVPASGFSDASHFNRCFKAAHGYAPSQCRRLRIGGEAASAPACRSTSRHANAR